MTFYGEFHMNLCAVIFDVDGTLAETEAQGHRVAFNQAFKEQGLDWNWSLETYKELVKVTGGKERIAHYQNDFIHQQVLDQDQIKALHLHKNRCYAQMLQQGDIPFRPGVVRLLKELFASEVKVAIATTTSPENIEALFSQKEAAGLLEQFDAIAAGDSVPQKKPAPDIYIKALNDMGVTAEQAIAVEDTHQGLRSAKGAGIKTLITYNSYTEDEDFTQADSVITQLGEPDNALQNIRGFAFARPYVDLEGLQAFLGEP